MSLSVSEIIEQILENRGILKENREAFLNPDYNNQHDPFLLPDMEKAVERLLQAHKKQEKITVYGDYDVDGVSASTIILDAFEKASYVTVCTSPFFVDQGLAVEKFKEIFKEKLL